MVCVRMGLLDDAIREHLELKRRRGADPEEVAREQREALDAAAERGAAGAAAQGADAQAAATDDSAPVPGEPIAVDPVVELSADEPQSQASGATDAGETAELDMSSVLGDESQADQPHDPPAQASEGAAAASARPVPARPATDEDSLEWEVPGETAEAEVEEPQEDVLEETPDFLRDTPEQDRLWFEQQPPRDFDFDK
jgi:hypothetical protein